MTPMTDSVQTLHVDIPRINGRTPPWGLRWRSSTWFIAFTVFLGILTDIANYGLIVPVIPFRLKEMGFEDNVGREVGWLVTSYAIGLVISSPVFAVLGEMTRTRRTPLLVSLLFMAAATVLFMVSDTYALMIVARVLQGISASGIWTLGLSLVCDSVPEERLGIVLGYVMIGMSCGGAIGPVAGGVLYAELGWRAPFIFALGLIFLDFVLRLLVIEKFTAIAWIEAGVEIPGFEAMGYTPKVAMKGVDTDSMTSVLATTTMIDEEAALASKEPIDAPTLITSVKAKQAIPWAALGGLFKSPRVLTLLACTFLDGWVLGGILDTGMTLWLNDKYGIGPLGAGLLFLGVVIPTIFVSPLAGHVCDRYPSGIKYTTVIGLCVGVASFALLVIAPIPLPLFVFFLALFGIATTLFVTPIAVDLSVVATSTALIGPAHCYGAFNLLFSIGTLVGPIASGHMIGALGLSTGWTTICSLSAVFTAALVIPSLLYVGGPLKKSTQPIGEGEVGVELKL